MTITTCVFDAYGTLFDVSAAARRAADADPALADIWQPLSEDWRRKQLEYSWLRAITGDHVPFREVTGNALDWAMERHGLTGDALRARLMDLYFVLDAYPEVPAMLDALLAKGLRAAILSNGSPDMLEAAVSSAGIGARLEAVLSVEDVGVFKPARSVYDLVGTRMGCAPEQVLFVSSNGWDAAGAAGYGFRTAWVNRAGLPMDRLAARPHHVLSDLTTISELC
ncbi:haloacid dehalogenase [Salipiger aestuarii]|uniref:(S)-2-haloacid dehalogenase n=1 Tax=Salipiger aestuarii TaxID=568098 RepID=A0A327YT16_9RHOB|nr:haloacid dehalogenase type II [Salipiger aestuarii]KAB2543279.1 haloacid dehalogenase [Salipiger aestuarii]RAK24063.1 2-haloacid dehalogenase [Salipiger aestuarii]